MAHDRVEKKPRAGASSSSRGRVIGAGRGRGGVNGGARGSVSGRGGILGGILGRSSTPSHHGFLPQLVSSSSEQPTFGKPGTSHQSLSDRVATSGRDLQDSEQVSTPGKEIQQSSSHSTNPSPHSPNKSTSPSTSPSPSKPRQCYVEVCSAVTAVDGFEGNGVRDWPNERRLCCLNVEETRQYRDKYIWVKSIIPILQSPWSLKYNKKKETYSDTLDWELILETFNEKHSWSKITNDNSLKNSYWRKLKEMKKLIHLHNGRAEDQSLQRRIKTTRDFVRRPRLQTEEDRQRGPGYSSQAEFFSLVPLQDELVIFHTGSRGQRVENKFQPRPDSSVALALEFPAKDNLAKGGLHRMARPGTWNPWLFPAGTDRDDDGKDHRKVEVSDGEEDGEESEGVSEGVSEGEEMVSTEEQSAVVDSSSDWSSSNDED